MTDIVSRLREAERYGQFGRSLLYGQVADEIERLRSEIGTSGPIDEDLLVKSHNHLGNPTDRADELVAVLRHRACPAGLPHTGDNPEEDHGHTDCWLHHQAADEIKYWQSEANKLAKLLMCEYVFVHERLIEEVDEALRPYMGSSNG